jgi:transglutaminase-like putative cysteine protease
VTRRGSDLSELLTVARPAGEVRYDNRREWALRQEVSLHSFAGETAGHIHLWLPDVQSSPAQRRVQLLNESHPPAVRFQEQARLYRVEPPRTEGSEEEPPPEEIRLARTFLFERYEVSAEVNPAAVPVEYEVDSAFLRRYTRREGRLRMEEEAIVAFAANSVGQVRNRYEQGSWIYRETLRVLEPDPDGTTDPLEALEGGSASADGYASLMVAALRTVGIPAREVAGVLFLDGVRSVRHRWVEFYLPEFGWFPADPALGDGLFADQLPPRPEGTEAATFYFGALDNRRGVFSHGEIPTPSMEMRGSSKRPGSLYALQKTYEEAADAVGAYESDWPVPELIGSY